MNIRSAAIPAMVAVGVFFAVSAPEPSTAYKRTQTCGDTYLNFPCDRGQEPKPLYWPVRCVRYRIHKVGSPSFPLQDGRELSEDLEELVHRSFDQWNKQECSDFQMVYGGQTPVGEANFNESAGQEGNQNIIAWRENSWNYDSRWAFALTSVTYNSNTGVIADADMEFNSATYDFVHLDEREIDESEERVDFLNTMTHEVGHFLGLDHPEDVEEATMWGSAPTGEIKKRTLHEDDIEGLCAIYPVEEEPATCESEEDFEFPPPGERARDGLDDKNGDNGSSDPPIVCGCRTTGGHPPLATLLFLVGLFVLRSQRPR